MSTTTRALPFRIACWVAIATAFCCRPCIGQTRVTLADHIGVDWQDELVHVPVRPERGTQRDPSAVRVTVAAGQAVASQVSDVVRDLDDGSIRSMNVWFLANVPANGSVTYAIASTGKRRVSAGVTVQEADGILELRSGKTGIGVRVPAGTRRFDWPVAIDTVPGPILGLLTPSGKWIGEGKFEAPFKVYEYTTRLVARGPLFAEAEVRYQLDVGEWVTKVKVVKDSPMIQVSEELDTGDSGLTAYDFDRFYTLKLNGAGFAPTQVFIGGNNYEPVYTGLLNNGIPDAAAAEAAGVAANWFAHKVNGATLAEVPAGRIYSLGGYSAANPRNGCLFRLVQPGGDSVGLVGLDPAAWRNPLGLRCEKTADGGVVLRLPIQKYAQRWSIDGVEPVSPNYTGTLRGVSSTTVRRRYGIALTRAEDETAAKLVSLFGLSRKWSGMPLDRVKDWNLEPPDPMQEAVWAAASTPATEKALAILRARILMKYTYGDLARFSMAYHYGYAKREYPALAAVVGDASQFTAADRRTFRRLCAFTAYDMHRVDTFPYGTGFHLNNPNMTIMAVEARAKSSSLIKDHPEFRRWGDTTLGLMREFFERFTMPSGAPFENPHYTIGVSMTWGAQVNRILMETGIGDAFEAPLFKKSLQFVMNWLTPQDPRFLGHRLLIAIGNGSYQSFTPDFAKEYVAYYQERDPVLAGQLQWAANQGFPDDKKLALVDDVVPELKSGWFKDYGVIFRHGYGTPYETMMHFLAGKCFGHYEVETDQMAYSIYAKGQPIHLHFGNGYFPMYNRPWLRNRISFGDFKMEAMERDPITVEHASFAPQAEYFRAVRHVTQLLPRDPEYPVLDDKNRWLPEENQNWLRTVAAWDKPEAQIPLTKWYRQMVFVKDQDPKGPNYFVLRDTFGATPTTHTDLNLWFLANKMTEADGVYHFDGQCKVDMDVFVNTPEAPAVHTDTYGHQQQPYGRLVGFDPAYHPGGKLGETQSLLRIRQPAGKGYLVVLYPRLKEIDPPATYERLADAVVRVQTPLSTDIVLLNSTPVEYAADGLSISGMACTVRAFKDGPTVVTNNDGPCTVAIAGKTISGHGAFVVTLDGENVTSETCEPAAQVEVK